MARSMKEIFCPLVLTARNQDTVLCCPPSRGAPTNLSRSKPATAAAGGIPFCHKYKMPAAMTVIVEELPCCNGLHRQNRCCAWRLSECMSPLALCLKSSDGCWLLVFRLSKRVRFRSHDDPLNGNYPIDLHRAHGNIGEPQQHKESTCHVLRSVCAAKFSTDGLATQDEGQ